MTAQARTIDLATVLAQEGGLLLLVSPGMAATIAARLDKYIFPGDKVSRPAQRGSRRCLSQGVMRSLALGCGFSAI